MWPNYGGTELVGTALKLRQRMKNSPSRARSPQNLEFGHLPGFVVLPSTAKKMNKNL